MGKEKNKLSAPSIRHAKVGLTSDGSGLYLQTTKTGAQSWVFRYRHGGRVREMGLGPYPAVSLSEARRLRDTHAETVRHGMDPIATRVEVRTMTFGAVTEEAFEALRPSLKAGGRAGRWMSPLDVHVLPKLGDRDITDLTQRDIYAVLQPIWRTKVSAAEKALQRIGIVLRHAEAAGLDVDPRIAARAKHLLGDQGHTVQNIRSMPWEDIPAFYASLGDSSADRALAFLILTASRSTPIRLATSAQIDGDVWTVPAEHMKGRRAKSAPFRVPLSDEALRLIEGSGGLLFPGPTGKPLSDRAMTAALIRKKLDCRPHGFRASFKTWGDDNHIDWITTESCLAHVVGSKVARAYARSDLLERRRPVMQSWSEFVTGGQSQIVHLRR